MKRRLIVTFVFLITASVFVARPADAGVGFGISIGGSHFALSFGYSDFDYPVYGPGWASSSWTIDLDTALDGYGSWIEVDGLGRVWHPWVAADWRPYTYGRWVFTSLGWTWVAYEPWGYIPHHYGSWAMTPFGWVWTPGYTYYPAHVTWLSVGASIGWYATPPYGWSDRYRAYRHGYRRGFDRGYARGYRNGWEDARYANFIDARRFTAENLARYVRPGDRYAPVVRNEIRVLRAGPERTRIERAAGRPIPRVRIAERRVSISGRSVRAVRPLGMTKSISRYSRTTVRTALAPSVARRLETRRGSASARSMRTPVQSRRDPATIQQRFNASAPAVRSRDVNRTARGARTSRWPSTRSLHEPRLSRSEASNVQSVRSRSFQPIGQPASRTSRTFSRGRRETNVRPRSAWTPTVSRRQSQRGQRTQALWQRRSTSVNISTTFRSTNRRTRQLTRERSAVSPRRFTRSRETSRVTTKITQPVRRTRSYRADRRFAPSSRLSRAARNTRARRVVRPPSSSRRAPSRRR
ncbi:MAG: hypothetical protein GXP48_05670 [Acidobacteria bacterium]|nr:hypothetical protein [Acidobacteriota bacterium]